VRRAGFDWAFFMQKIMAENKKGFLLYADYEELFEELSDENAGKLIKHIIQYVNDKNPVTENVIVNIAFIPIKRQLKRDLESYESKREQWSEAGKKSAEARRLKREQTLNDVPTNLTTVETVATDLTVNVNDNVNDNVINKDLSPTKVDEIDFEKLLSFINFSFGRKFQIVSKKVRSSYNARIKEGYTKDQITDAINNCKENDYHKENNYQYCTPEFFSRSETLDKYSNVTKQDKIVYAFHPVIFD
jgi:uncharacterized phage protein (TIGR02220 family)